MQGEFASQREFADHLDSKRLLELGRADPFAHSAGICGAAPDEERTVLDQGHVLMVGTVEEVKNSRNERIQNLLNRRFEEEEVDPDAYLARLMGET